MSPADCYWAFLQLLVELLLENHLRSEYLDKVEKPHYNINEIFWGKKNYNSPVPSYQVLLVGKIWSNMNSKAGSYC